MISESTLIKHIPCPSCGSKDNCALYSDGHTYCFGCQAHTQGDSEHTQPTRRKVAGTLIDGVVEPLRARGITQATCAHFGYKKGELGGKSVQVAPYFDADGNMVAQKVRGADKQFKVLGDLSEAMPFGSQAFQKTGKRITVTEGEIDALTMSQVQDNKWPVVSIPNGASSVKKHFAKHLDYYKSFDEVVLMFDMDEPGRKAALEAASILGPRALIAELPSGFKDPNEMLQAGKVKELIDSMWRAKKYRPEGIVEMSSLKDRVLTPPGFGMSWPWESLTEPTYGIPERAVVTIGGAGGGGKTDVLAQVMQHLVTAHRQGVGVFSLEQDVAETARRIAGKFAKKTFHVPDSGWTVEDISVAFDAVSQAGKVFLYDSFGVNEWDAIESKIEYLRHAEGVRFFFVDNLTALVAAEDNEKEGLERIMGRAGSLVQALDITIFFVSHLATPEGTPHEEGGRVMGKHFKGSRTIIFWSYLMLGLERNQQAENEKERQTTCVRVLKERKTGRGLGKCMYLHYDHDTGLLNETEKPKAASTFGFTEESPTNAF